MNTYICTLLIPTKSTKLRVEIKSFECERSYIWFIVFKNYFGKFLSLYTTFHKSILERTF